MMSSTKFLTLPTELDEKLKTGPPPRIRSIAIDDEVFGWVHACPESSMLISGGLLAMAASTMPSRLAGLQTQAQYPKERALFHDK